MLNDRTDDELAKSSCSWRAITAPSSSLIRWSGCSVLRGKTAIRIWCRAWHWCDRGQRVLQQRQGMRHATHHEFAWQVIETIRVFENQTKLAHQHRVLEVIGESRNKLRHKYRIVGRKIEDELCVDREVRVLAMTCSASATIAVKGFVEETGTAALNGVFQRRRRIWVRSDLSRRSRAYRINHLLKEPALVGLRWNRIRICQHAKLSLLFAAIHAME